MTADEMKRLANEALEIAGKATEGPWKVCDYIRLDETRCVGVIRDGTVPRIVFEHGHAICDDSCSGDAKFIADARTRAPALANALLAEVAENEKNMRYAKSVFDSMKTALWGSEDERQKLRAEWDHAIDEVRRQDDAGGAHER